MYIFWRHYCNVKPNCSSFGTFTIIILSVLISRTFTVWRGLRGWGFSRLALVLYENLKILMELARMICVYLFSKLVKVKQGWQLKQLIQFFISRVTEK